METRQQLNKNKLILPISILLASIVIGGFYYASQVSKQKSIERQQEIKIEEEKSKENELRKNLDACLNDAKDKFNNAIKPFLDNKREGLDEAYSFLESKYATNKNDCFKKYPQ